MKNKIYCLLTLIALAFISCGEEDVLSNKFALEKIIYHENADQIGMYQYHEDGSIQRYEYHFDNVMVDYTDYLYSSDKLVAKNYYEITSEENFRVFRTDLFSYGSNGKVKEFTLDKDGPNETKYTFTWANGKVERADCHYTGIFSEQKSFYEVKYDKKGNASKVTFFSIIDGLPRLDYIVEYEYDNKVNPLRELTEPHNFELRGPNNVVKSTQRSTEDSLPYSVQEIEYIYDEFDLPQERTEVINLDGSISSSNHKYFYRKL